MKKTTFLNALFFSFCAILVNSATMAQTDSVMLEAECGTVGANWTITEDETASDGRFVTITPVRVSANPAAEVAEDQLSFTINVTAGTYKLWARVNATSAADDSFWVNIDGSTWNKWQPGGTAGYIWHNEFDDYTLTAGTHTITISFREDGLQMDKFYITKKADDEPTDLGAVASNACAPVVSVKDHTNEVAEILMYPNPASDILSIYLPGNENKPTNLSVYNTNGSLVKTITAENGDNKVDIKKLTNGLYFIVFNINNKVYSKKFVKQ